MDHPRYGGEEKDSAVDLGRDRLVNTRKHYQQLQSMSYEIPLNKEKAGVPKWLQQKLKSQGLKSIPPRIYGNMHRTNPRVMKKALEEHNSKN